MASLRIFISYNTIDKALAGHLKVSLEQYGLSPFLAHDDIKPTQSWVDMILDELNKSEVFLPLLTKSFSKSAWTAQEVGIALAKNILVIPLKVDKNPPGFLGRIQALRFRSTNIDRSCYAIAQVISRHQPTQRNFLNGIIKIFEDSDSFEAATHNTKVLNYFDGYTPSQADAIVRSAKDNYQIYHSFLACRELRTFIHKHRKLANLSTLKVLERRMV